eukprot:1611309-Ditylum_brightwellii.AAC.1
MTFSAKTVQWHNGMQNHQNGHLLPVLDPKVAGYKAEELFQWEMCLQFHSWGALTKIPTIEVDAGKRIELETFPKKAQEIKTFLSYE